MLYVCLITHHHKELYFLYIKTDRQTKKKLTHLLKALLLTPSWQLAFFPLNVLLNMLVVDLLLLSKRIYHIVWSPPRASVDAWPFSKDSVTLNLQEGKKKEIWKNWKKNCAINYNKVLLLFIGKVISEMINCVTFPYNRA